MAYIVVLWCCTCIGKEDQNVMKRSCEEDENYIRPGRGRGRGRGRISKKRGEEEDDDPWYIKKRRKHGEGQHLVN